MGRDTANRRLGRRLALAACVMFGFGYALVPLYDAFCKITGLNGKPDRRAAERIASGGRIDKDRDIKIEFMTSVSPGFPWELRPVSKQIRIRLGEVVQVWFYAKNLSATATTGRAVPSVAPNAAARFLIKTECFCFTEQSLAGGEGKEMPVRFIVDPALPREISTVTLSYALFDARPATDLVREGETPHTAGM